MAYKFYVENELDLNELFSACGCSYEEMQEENAHITIETLLKSLTLIKKHLKPEISLARELESQLNLSDFGAFSFTLLAAPSLKEGLELIINGFNIMDPSFEFNIKHHDSNNIIFSIENPGYFKEFNEEILDLSCLMLFKYVKCFISDKELINFRKLDNNDIIKSRNKREVVISNTLLKLVSVMTHPAFFYSNRNKIIKKSKQYKHLKGCVLSVNKIIRNHVKKGYKPCLNDISKQLGTTSKTLSRLLKAHNTSFQACLDQVICDLAINLIQEEYNTKEIAYSLGFQSIAGLNYLFIKRYGLTLNQLKASSNFPHQHTSSSA